MSDILLVGGSGFLSGTVAHTAVAQGHNVWAVTRGQRPVLDGVTSIKADRRNGDDFANAIAQANHTWDLVIDSIGYDPEHAQQDIATFRERAAHLIFVSTDFTFDPRHTTFPQPEETDHYLQEGYGGKKRLCELEFENGDTGNMQWSVVRPCHIYGPGSKLGCLPNHGRDDQLIDRLRNGEPLQLVGGGHFLQQPIFARDLAETMLSMAGNPNTYGQIFCTPGPEMIESRAFYDIIADILEVDRPQIEEISVTEYLNEHPGQITFCCHRIYTQDKLKAAGAQTSHTTVAGGLKEHLESML